jgi:hypothetical protein
MLKARKETRTMNLDRSPDRGEMVGVGSAVAPPDANKHYSDALSKLTNKTAEHKAILDRPLAEVFRAEPPFIVLNT